MNYTVLLSWNVLVYWLLWNHYLFRLCWKYLKQLNLLTEFFKLEKWFGVCSPKITNFVTCLLVRLFCVLFESCDFFVFNLWFLFVYHSFSGSMLLYTHIPLMLPRSSIWNPSFPSSRRILCQRKYAAPHTDAPKKPHKNLLSSSRRTKNRGHSRSIHSYPLYATHLPPCPPLFTFPFRIIFRWNTVYKKSYANVILFWTGSVVAVAINTLM